MTFVILNNLVLFAFSEKPVLDIWRQLNIYGDLA